MTRSSLPRSCGSGSAAGVAGSRILDKASVEGDLRSLDAAAATRVVAKIEKTLTGNGTGGKALTGEFAGLFSIQAGDDRAIYARIDDGFLILRIAHRRDVYRKGRP